MNLTHHLHLIYVFHSVVFAPAYMFLLTAPASSRHDTFWYFSSVECLFESLYFVVSFGIRILFAAKTQKFGFQKSRFEKWLTAIVQLNLEILVIDYLLLLLLVSAL